MTDRDSAPLRYVSRICVYEAVLRGRLRLKIFYEDHGLAVFDFGNRIIILLKQSEAGDLIAPAAIAGPTRWFTRAAIGPGR
jgi:hypothetical protein